MDAPVDPPPPRLRQTHLVVGGLSFVGRFVAAVLIARGDSVRVLDADGHTLTLDGVEHVVAGGAGDAAALDAALRGARVHTVFHAGVETDTATDGGAAHVRFAILPA